MTFSRVVRRSRPVSDYSKVVIADRLDTQALIQAVDAADSASALVQSVRALAAAQDTAAIPTLIEVLGFNNPGAAIAAVDGLVQLDSEAVPALLAQLDGYNYGARAWAIRALALIGDPRALDILVDTAQGDFALSVRRAAARGLGKLQWHRLATDDVPAAQAAAQRALLKTLDDPEWVVRYAAVVGLADLAIALQQRQAIAELAALQEPLQQRADSDEEAVVRARASLAIATLAQISASC